MKRAVLLTIQLICSIVLFANSFEYNGIRYEISANNPDECILLQNISQKGEVVIPTVVINAGKEYIVTSIADYAFNGCVDITTVAIPSTVTKIGHLAFYACDNLKSISIPNSIEQIGNWAFGGCI